MKIIIFSPYITIAEVTDFNKNHSGFGYMVSDITLGLGKFTDLEIEVLTQSNFTKGVFFKNVKFIKKNVFILLSYLSFNIIKFSIAQVCKYNKTDILRQLIYSTTSAYFKKISSNYDAIHIHGITPYTFKVIDHCIDNSLKALVTIHGINFLDNSVGISDIQKNEEKKYLKKIISSSSVKLSVVSSGIKNRIVENLSLPEQKIYLVPNFNHFSSVKYPTDNFDIRDHYKIDKNAKVVLSVGNYSIRKNQKQLIEILSYVKTRDVFLLFVGTLTNEFIEYVKNSNQAQRIILCGNVERNRLPSYYAQSNILAMTSKSEGFGLPIIEAFSFGLPCISFSNIDAIKDVYHRESMILVHSLESTEYAERLDFGLHKKWNKNKILKISEKFSYYKILDTYKSLLLN